MKSNPYTLVNYATLCKRYFEHTFAKKLTRIEKNYTRYLNTGATMLGFMRRKANHWLMTALFAAIIFVFAVSFGNGAGKQGGEPNFAAEVNGTVITLAQFQSAYSERLRRMQQFRPDYSPEQADKDGMRSIIIDQLVAQELLAQLAQTQGLTITNIELAKAVKEHIFGNDKPFDLKEYQRIVNSYLQMSPSQFENQLRRQMLAREAANIISTGGMISENELKEAFNMRNTKASVDFIRLDPRNAAVATPSESEALAYAASNTEQISRRYEENAAISDNSEKAKSLDEAKIEIAREFIIKDKQKAAAMLVAEDIVKQLKNGVALDKLSLAKGFEKSTKGNSGLFSRFGRSNSPQLSKEIESAAFSLNKDHPTSEKIFENHGALVVIRLKELQSPDETQFATQKESLQMALNYQRKGKFVEQYIEYLKKNARIVYNEALHKAIS